MIFYVLEPQIPRFSRQEHLHAPCERCSLLAVKVSFYVEIQTSVTHQKRSMQQALEESYDQIQMHFSILFCLHKTV